MIKRAALCLVIMALAAPGKAQSLAQAIADAIELRAKSPEMRAVLAENAKNYVTETFDINAMLSAYEETYGRLLNK